MPSQLEYHYNQIPNWERISAPNLVDSEHREFMITCRRECCRTAVHTNVNALHSNGEPIHVPTETSEYIYVVVVGTSIPTLEEFTETLKQRIDEQIQCMQPVNNIKLETPQYVDYYLINTSSVSCPHGNGNRL